MPEKVELLERLKAQIKSLKEGNHNSGTMQIMIANIEQAIVSGQVTWEQLNTSELELEIILKKKIRQEKGIESETKNFLEYWQEYYAGKKDVQCKLLSEFRLVKKALDERRITPDDLLPEFPPHEFFVLDRLLSEQVK